jgi:hypothetical protein
MQATLLFILAALHLNPYVAAAPLSNERVCAVNRLQNTLGTTLPGPLRLTIDISHLNGKFTYTENSNTYTEVVSYKSAGENSPLITAAKTYLQQKNVDAHATGFNAYSATLRSTLEEIGGLIEVYNPDSGTVARNLIVYNDAVGTCL